MGCPELVIETASVRGGIVGLPREVVGTYQMKPPGGQATDQSRRYRRSPNSGSAT